MTPFQMIVSALVVLALVIILYFWKFKHPPLGGPPNPPNPPGPPPAGVIRELYVADAGDGAIWTFAIADDTSLLQVPPDRYIKGDLPYDPGMTQLSSPMDVAVDRVSLFVLNQYIDGDGNLLPGNGVDPNGNPLPNVNPILIFNTNRRGDFKPYSWWGPDAFPHATDGTPQAVPLCMAISSKNPDSLLLGEQGTAGTFVQQMDKFPQAPGNHGQPVTSNLNSGYVTGIATHTEDDGTVSFALVWTNPPQVPPSQNPPPQYAVLFFANTPNFAGVPAMATQTITGPNKSLNRPQRIAFGPDGSLFVTNWGDQQGDGSVTIYVRDANGNYQFVQRIGGLWQPTGIALGIDGTIYVADLARILVFDPRDVAAAKSDVIEPKQVVEVNTMFAAPDGTNQMPLSAELNGMAIRTVL